MAEEKFQYTLELSTRAIGDGAKRTADDMERLNRAVTASQDKAKVSEFGYYDLDAQMRRTTRTTETFTSGVTKMKGPVRDNSQVLLLFSQGFEDASYGIRGVLNNIPGLIIALGGTAGLAGGISIAAVAFSQLLPLLTQTKETSADAAEKLTEVATKMGELQQQKLETTLDEIKKTADETLNLKNKWEDSKEAADDYALASLDNAADLRVVENEINELLGIRISKLDDLAKRETEAAEKRRLERDQKLEAERAKLNAVQDELTIREVEYENLVRDKEKNEELLRTKNEQLGNLRARLTTLENIKANGTEDARRLDAASPFDTPGFEQQRVRQEAASQAEGLAGRIQMIEAEVEKIRAFNQSSDADLRNTANALQSISNRRDDLAKAVAISSQGIVEDYEKSEVKAQLQSVQEKSKTLAAEIQAAAEGVKVNTEQGIAVKDSLLSAASDGKITADESVKVASDLRQVLGLIQANQATSSTSLAQLIALQKANEQILRLQNDQIRDLWNSLKVLQAVKR